jgi:glycine/D-amino acid oxidase-like deaminating enzyme/nitrite reductase/ring-hydroxylating ferredoxin subunit
MSVSREFTTSLWMDTEVLPDAPRLSKYETTGTAIVGSGIAGLSTAYELAKRGQDVVVLDRGPIGKGMTSRTTAHLSPICDDTFSALIRIRGEDAARAYHESQSAAVDRIEAIQQTESIVCDFRRLDGVLFPALGAEPSVLDPELEAARKLKVPVKDTKGLPFEGLSKTRCLRYPQQATFHPLKYLRGLARAIQLSGGRFYANTTVETVAEDGDGVIVTTADGKSVRAKAAVLATNSPINDRVAIHTKQAPYRTYAMAFVLPKGALDDALYWDTLDPYHYVRIHPGTGNADHLIVGGADHKSGEADDAGARYDALEGWIRALVPSLKAETHRWSGQTLDTIDYSGFIGRNPGDKRVYIATGDSGQGITNGALAGLILSDLILKGENVWASLYDPSRKTPSAVANFISENVTAVKNFAEYLAPGELKSVDELKLGQGAIVREGLQKIAAYRDEDGRLHKRSAKCTHLGCHVHWNSLERCWDCPCHGSQFAPDGTALNGPAVAPLAEIK